jgi:tagaturonate epimerase
MNRGEDSMKLPKYTIGVGDRFGLEGEAQLSALIEAQKLGIPVHPVWNKSKREHDITGTTPESVREEADSAVKALGWNKPYFVDADHINSETVPAFIESSDFFTIDVAEEIGKKPTEEDKKQFLEGCTAYRGAIEIPGISAPIEVEGGALENIADTYLAAVKEAGRVYRKIEEKKGKGNFITEVSMDETENPQTPVELLFILKALADENVPVDTIAPKFIGRFNKGVDYVGNVERFKKDFHDHLDVIDFAKKEFGTSESCKMSIHSGSDKFSIYPFIKEECELQKSGIHLKTAGTTWLEEIIGLAEAGNGGLVIAKDLYARAYRHFEELRAPYASVIDVEIDALPTPDAMDSWGNKQLAEALRHEQNMAGYNPQLRQFFHISYKMVVPMWNAFKESIEKNSDVVRAGVKSNLLQKHILPLFPKEA